MVGVDLIIYTTTYMIYAIIILWKVSLIMLEKKRIIVFLPFFIMGILFCFQGAFLFNALFEQMVWFFVESVFLILFIWISLNLWREK